MTTDEQLKRSLALMLPELLKYTESQPELYWWVGNECVLESELLYICHLIQENIRSSGNLSDWNLYLDEIGAGQSMRIWQCYARALVIVRKVEL